MDFDVSQHELRDTCVITLKSQRGDDSLGTDGQPITVELWSPGSDAGVKALAEAGRAQGLRMMRTFKGDLDPKDAEKAERERVRKLTGFTKAISQNCPLTPEQVFSNPKLCHWRDQVEKAVSDYSNF